MKTRIFLLLACAVSAVCVQHWPQRLTDEQLRARMPLRLREANKAWCLAGAPVATISVYGNEPFGGYITIGLGPRIVMKDLTMIQNDDGLCGGGVRLNGDKIIIGRTAVTAPFTHFPAGEENAKVY